MISSRHQLLAAAVAIALASCGNNSRNADTPAAEAEQPTAVAAESPVIELTDMNMWPDNGRLVVIDFNATWCGPCRMFAPMFHDVARQYNGKADFVSVDVDKFPELAGRFGVSSIPHVAFLQPDGSIDAVVGTDRLADFASLVEEHLSK